MDAAVIHVEYEGEDDVPVASESQRTFEFLPVSHIEAAVIETWLEDIVVHTQLAYDIEQMPAETHAIALPGAANQVNVANCPAICPRSEEWGPIIAGHQGF